MELRPCNEVKLELPQRANVNLFSLIFVIRITDFARKEGLLVVYTQVGFLCPVFPGRIGI